MPLAELTIARGILSDRVVDALVQEITDIFLGHQGARPGSRVARSIACMEVREVEAARFFVGGVPTDKPRYRLVFTVPEGALDRAKKASLVEQATRTILAHEGVDWSEEDAHRVWCIVSEVPDGNWGSAGRIFRWRDITRWVARGELALRRGLMRAPEGELTH